MPKLDTLIATLFSMMTRHGQSTNANLEKAIADHLQMLLNHPDCDSEVLKTTGERLLKNWRQEARIKELGIGSEAPSDGKLALH